MASAAVCRLCSHCGTPIEGQVIWFYPEEATVAWTLHFDCLVQVLAREEDQQDAQTQAT